MIDWLTDWVKLQLHLQLLSQAGLPWNKCVSVVSFLCRCLGFFIFFITCCHLTFTRIDYLFLPWLLHNHDRTSFCNELWPLTTPLPLSSPLKTFWWHCGNSHTLKITKKRYKKLRRPKWKQQFKLAQYPIGLLLSCFSFTMFFLYFFVLLAIEEEVTQTKPLRQLQLGATTIF